MNTFFFCHLHAPLHSLADDLGFELGKRADDIQKEPSVCGRGIEIVFDEYKILSGLLELSDDEIEVNDISREPIDLRCYDDIKILVREELGEFWSVFEVLSTCLL